MSSTLSVSSHALAGVWSGVTLGRVGLGRTLAAFAYTPGFRRSGEWGQTFPVILGVGDRVGNEGARKVPKLFH